MIGREIGGCNVAKSNIGNKRLAFKEKKWISSITRAFKRPKKKSDDNFAENLAIARTTIDSYKNKPFHVKSRVPIDGRNLDTAV